MEDQGYILTQVRTEGSWPETLIGLATSLRKGTSGVGMILCTCSEKWYYVDVK